MMDTKKTRPFGRVLFLQKKVLNYSAGGAGGGATGAP